MLFAASRFAKDFALSPIALALLANCAVVPWVHATPGCQVDPTNAPPISPAGCTTSDTFVGWFSPSVLYVGNGGQYVAPAQGLNITHTNQPPPAAAQGGTQGITVYGQDNAAPPNVSSVRSPGAAKVSIQLTNTFTSSSPAVYALTGGRAEFDGDLTVTTSTISTTLTAQALAARGQSVPPLMNIGSLIQVEGVATLDTTAALPAAPSSYAAVLADQGGQIKLNGGGSLRSGDDGIWAFGSAGSPGAVRSTGGPFTLTAHSRGVVIDSGSGRVDVQLDDANVTSVTEAITLTGNNRATYTQNSGQISSSIGDGLLFAAGTGDLSVLLRNSNLRTSAPAGNSAYAVHSQAANASLNFAGGTLHGPIYTASNATLRLEMGTGGAATWETGGDPATVQVNSLTTLYGTPSIVLEDIKDSITLRGDADPAVGCGNAMVTFVIGNDASVPPLPQPYTVMICERNSASTPSAVLSNGEGGAFVMLGGKKYTLKTVPATQASPYTRYNLVLVDVPPVVDPGTVTPSAVASVPAINTAGLTLLALFMMLVMRLRLHRKP